ncbi:MAG TPA: bifunctional hydroxymethylpyrimidine kinase/phosphomethylpyrimidine kinase [Thermoanaerobaculia bacterium]|nr:bifunctional hydroxymethylpyrimidine kinase/phosphomethylpyrimidine kinase [Thermoanaerobaculia bacterium]
MSHPIALTVAGSDPCGGAGLQADLKTFEALDVYGTSVVTAVTAQNTVELTAVHDVPSAVVRQQLRAVLSDLPPRAVKVGMLSSVPSIRAVVQELSAQPAPIVVDPIMVSKTGAPLLRATSLDALVGELFPIATLVTPNLPEASLLAGFPIRSEVEAKLAARRIQALGPRAVLVTGGHSDGPVVVDGLLDGRTWIRYAGERIETTSTHGTGCTLSAAIAAYLARGEELPDAVAFAISYVRRALALAPGVGAGAGPLGHHRAGLAGR